jgi:hypothetical protein
MKKTHKPAAAVSADAIARLADQGKDVSHFFRGQGLMIEPTFRLAQAIPVPDSVGRKSGGSVEALAPQFNRPAFSPRRKTNPTKPRPIDTPA